MQTHSWAFRALQHAGLQQCAALHSLQTFACALSTGTADAQLHQQQGAPPVYNIQLLLKSFELRYIKEASNVVRDLLLLNMAPKGRSLLPGSTESKTPVNLRMPLGDAAIPQKMSRYTVLRSPHVDKKSREQFERRIYKRSVQFGTTSLHEVHWFLDHLKTYDFTGVQVQVNLSGNTYIMRPNASASSPSPSTPSAAASGMLLSEHHAKLLAQQPARTTTPASAAKGGGGGGGASVGATLDSLSGMLSTAMREQQQQIAGSRAYQRWWQDTAAGPAVDAGASSDPVKARLKQLLAGTLPAGAIKRSSALLQAIDNVLLGMRASGDAAGQPELAAAELAIGGSTPVAQPLQQLLKSTPPDAAAAGGVDGAQLGQHSALTHAVLYELLRLWFSGEEAAQREIHKLPDEQLIARCLADLAQQQRAKRGA